MEYQNSVEHDGHFTGSKFLWKLGACPSDAGVVSSPKFKDENDNEWIMRISHGIFPTFEGGVLRLGWAWELELQVLELGGGLKEFTATIGIGGPSTTGVAPISNYKLVTFTFTLEAKKITFPIIFTNIRTDYFIHLQICNMNAGGLYGTLRRERLYLAWKELLNDGKFSDVVISTCGKSFPGHKAVLSARSPVFQAMFSNACSESQENRVDLSVFPEAVVKGFLEFIYTDKTEVLPEYAEDWLRIADMYQLDGLKTDAGAAIIKTLTVENALEVFRLAHTYSVEDLKPKVTAFMKRNSPGIASNESGMKQLAERSPELVAKVIKEMFA